MRAIVTVVFLFAAFSGPAAGAEAAKINLRVLAQESMPPKWLMRDGRREGLCPDIIAAIEKVEPQLHFTGYNDYRSTLMIEKALEAGTVDATCGLLDTPRRRQIAQVAGPSLYVVRQRLVARRDDTAVVRNFDDLLKLQSLIVVTRGSSIVEQLRALGLKVDDSNGDNRVNLKKVAAGHGRFFYMNELTLTWLLQSEQLQGQFRLLPGALKEEPIYFWLSKKVDPATTSLAGRALDKLQASGELARIYKRWATREPYAPGSR
ncbi:substrate-binding periplasmic protein [Janthinobacterium agaricidamnosum]|uniref:Solute-binding protein family 3/N-terminal domain-containing protein n=1 Tax=Janthinobacterium agaricidamnosum NBRC 102515 = DSM 9628 TaxID=1349767 RepID=W0V8B1_9BURK|nr:transporter substrate-binding domain-containing protein [Janthinobacterium agaricidamnosum]CDG83492.1 hypothetical protein GJA_2863 [Janthinobacterium agaricidamnosum NBRC 102515 = DSM 9628]